MSVDSDAKLLRRVAQIGTLLGPLRSRHLRSSWTRTCRLWLSGGTW